MGPRAARIVREEFLTPPEFLDLAPGHDPAARVGGARIELLRRGDATRLGACYQQIPVRLAPPFVLDDEPASLLYLINLTAGLMDGDAHLIQLHARRGARAVVTGQSATRVHPALKGYATQQWAIEVEDDSCLVILPGPAIPFRGSRYYQRGRVTLAPGARLLWGDLWLAGRYERGPDSERFAFDRIVQDLEVRRSGRLVYRDRFRWDGPWTPEEACWYFAGEMAVASLVAAGPPTERLDLDAPGLRAAAFPLDTGVHCYRWCGHPIAVSSALVRASMRIAADWTGGPAARPWLLESTELSPIHWFSTPPVAC